MFIFIPGPTSGCKDVGYGKPTAGTGMWRWNQCRPDFGRSSTRTC